MEHRHEYLTTPAEPDARAAEMRQLEPAIRTVWTIRIAVAATMLFAAALLFDVVALGMDDERGLPTGAVTVAALLLGALWVIAVPRLRYRFWRFALREEELLLERGIWNRVRTVVPLRRIQHLDVSQTFVERQFKLGRLIVHTAGTRSNAVELPGLDIEEAEHLRETIKQYVIEDTL